MTQQLKTFGNPPAPQRRRGLVLAVVIALLLIGAIVVFSPPAGPQQAGPVAAPGTVCLTVESQPSGASLMINGRLVGATPVVLAGLQPGRYGVRLEKDGCAPLLKCVELGGVDELLRESLEKLPAGVLTVDIEPRGAEVLIDGEVVGNTPLKNFALPVGSYELLIRKTNFDSYAKRVEIEQGEEAAFSGFKLNDKVRAMLEGLVKSEPQRVAHYIDLGHYLFVNDLMDEAVSVFADGLDVQQAPLDFDGPGYPGKAEMTVAEMQNEDRLRKEDEQRFVREMEKHRNWPGKNTRLFRQKLEEAQDLSRRKNITSWAWAEQYARQQIKAQMYERAAQAYTNHIEATPKDAPHLPLAYAGLLEVHLIQRDVQRAGELFEKLFIDFNDDRALMLRCGALIAPYYDRMVGFRDRKRVLELAEKALRRGIELAKDPVEKSQASFELGTVLMNQSKPELALDFFRQSAAETKDPAMKEDRELRMADALRKSGRLKEAKELYGKLSESERRGIAATARAGLVYIQTDEAIQKKP